ncbi:PDZK1-interacting protein 1 [Synchiropus splendidus]|uniref:PDZK1-interacting protein 1 n=1 Tax=Synchiropus splendidus TaxID=270530 RepID=UPI00237EA0F7|nr:PDZK1-interacting protein 1 [Synchiropus splendidus]
MRLLPVQCVSLLLLVTVEAQTVGSEVSRRPLPPWLTGLISVSVFLFLVFVVFLVKRAWFSDHSRRSSLSESHRKSTSGVCRIKQQENEAVTWVTAM